MKVSTVFYLFSHLLNPYVSALPLLLLHSLYLSSTVRLAQTPLFFKLNFLLFLKILFPLLPNSSSLVISTFTLIIPTLPLVLPSFPYLTHSVFLNLSLFLPTQLAILLIFSSLALPPLFSDIDYACPSLSDHHAILSVFSVPSHSRSPRITKLIRKTKSINVTSFSNDIYSSCLHSSPPFSLSSYLQLFASTLSHLIDKHVPLITDSCSSNTCKPFITDSILKQKSLRSKLESAYRRNKTDATKLAFRRQANVVSKLITTARRSYYRTLISLSANQPKKLWASLDSLLSRKTSPSLPTSPSPSLLATSFLNFFGDKIANSALPFFS